MNYSLPPGAGEPVPVLLRSINNTRGQAGGCSQPLLQGKPSPGAQGGTARPPAVGSTGAGLSTAGGAGGLRAPSLTMGRCRQLSPQRGASCHPWPGGDRGNMPHQLPAR